MSSTAIFQPKYKNIEYWNDHTNDSGELMKKEDVYSIKRGAQTFLIAHILYQDKSLEDLNGGIIDLDEFNRIKIPRLYGKSNHYIRDFCEEKEIPIPVMELSSMGGKDKKEENELKKTHKQWCLDRILKLKKLLKKNKQRIREYSQYNVSQAQFMYSYYLDKFKEELIFSD